MRKYLNVFVMVMALTPLAAFTQTNQSPVLQMASHASVDSLLIDYTGNQPGISIVVIHDGKAVYSKSTGMADRELNVPVTPATNFRLASFTKQFTAMGIMLLEEKGKLSLQDPLSKYFPELPAWAKEMQLHHLLTHTSGIVGYESLVPDTATIPVSGTDVIRMLSRCDSVYFKPGAKISYSNSAYVLLGLIIEKASGKSYKDFMTANIFKPLKMTGSTINDPSLTISNRAYGYTVRKDSIQRTDQSLTSYTLGDGGIYSSINDLFKWDQALYTTKLVKATTMQKIYTIHSCFNPGSPTEQAEGFGYGWVIKHSPNGQWVSHSGGTRGFSTWITRNPSQQFSIILLANRSNQNLETLSDKIKTLYGF